MNDHIPVHGARHDCGWKFPGLDEDRLPSGNGIFCATRSKKQLKFWFNKKELTILHKFGYKVLKLRVKDKSAVRYSDIQCTFYRRGVELLETCCPTKFI